MRGLTFLYGSISVLDINFKNLVYIRYAVAEKVVTFKSEGISRGFQPKIWIVSKGLEGV